MTKLKLKKLVISNADEFAENVNRVAMLETELDETEARYTLLEQRLKARKERHTKAKDAEKTRLMKACAKFAEEHPDKVLEDGKRSGETPQATYGFRTGNPTVSAAPGCTLKGVLEALLQKSRAIQQRFLTFPAPKLNKDAIRDLMKPRMMKELGVEIVQEESFYIKPKGKDKGGAE